MSYLVDTNVLSELRRREPNQGVIEWFEQRPAGTLYLSVLTLGEIRKGIDLLNNDDRQLKLLDWLEVELPQFFSGRILSVDADVADRWGRLIAQIGRPIPAIDSLIAATALRHGLKLVTRNVRDFSYPELDVINPWRD
ncbi:type II toxin-antitoxin system VapC family toxin [Methylotuvimicrobium buryatense]|uniref:Ribonuclease VapC n=1 Tax=Methylotuvimicrobium buryatense TaxID=95641 RepID=A0A4P9UJA5_METBY|nr:type II toxin-antitoxin system VapC family toxin [Methylotuvimicrobium buryatense]QCW81148.1 type II toxin-antitoxin system VapC family toxin [Methylotuvimicrobium buryatense]